MQRKKWFSKGLHFLKKKECLKAVLSPRNAPHLLIRMSWQILELLWVRTHHRTHSALEDGHLREWVLWWLREMLVSLALKYFHFVLQHEEKSSWWAVMVSGEIILLSWVSKELSSCDYLSVYLLSWSMKSFNKSFFIYATLFSRQ